MEGTRIRFRKASLVLPVPFARQFLRMRKEKEEANVGKLEFLSRPCMLDFEQAESLPDSPLVAVHAVLLVIREVERIEAFLSH